MSHEQSGPLKLWTAGICHKARSRLLQRRRRNVSHLGLLLRHGILAPLTRHRQDHCFSKKISYKECEILGSFIVCPFNMIRRNDPLFSQNYFRTMTNKSLGRRPVRKDGLRDPRRQSETLDFFSQTKVWQTAWRNQIWYESLGLLGAAW